MKKLFVLTSVLSLAACAFGGGDKSGTGVPPSGGYVDMVRESNSVITGMVSNSEYQVARYVANKLGEDAADVNLTRGASNRGAFVPSPTIGNLDYDTANELVQIAAWLVDDTTSEADIISKFETSSLDKNKIKAALKLLDGMWCYVGGSASETAERVLQRRESFQEPLAELQEKTEVFNLRDVEFKTEAGGVLTTLVFNVNNTTGQVESIEYPHAQEIMDEYIGSDVTVGPIMRNGNTNSFIEHFTVDEETSPLYGQTISVPTEYVSYGRQLGLRYSDFGVLRTDFMNAGFEGAEDWGVWQTPFIGGYTTKQIANDDMRVLAADNDIVFTGSAKGDISYHDWAAGLPGSTGADIPLAGGLNDDQATLTFTGDGTQIFSADFTNWAQIQAVKAADGTNQFIVAHSYVDTDSPYYLESSPAGLIEGDYITYMGDHQMQFITGYYGNADTPTEAVGLVKYGHQWGDPYYVEAEDRWDIENHLQVVVGFGGLTQPQSGD